MGWPKTPWTEAQRAWAVCRIKQLRAGLRATAKERRWCRLCGRHVLVINGKLRSHGFDSLRPFTSRCKASGRRVRNAKK